MKLAVALDLPARESLSLIERLRNAQLDFAVKVGSAQFIESGPTFISKLKGMGLEICLDLKLHDIPNTMREAAKRIADLGVDMLTLHASAGREAMEQVAIAIDACDHHPKLLAVTVLTSMTDDVCYDIYGMDVLNKVESFAATAMKSGMDGFVCSVHEALILRPVIRDLLLYVPGIRWDDTTDDQARAGTVDLAFANGADYIVVGRPIYNHPEPEKITKQILNKIEGLKPQ